MLLISTYVCILEKMSARFEDFRVFMHTRYPLQPNCNIAQRLNKFIHRLAPASILGLPPKASSAVHFYSLIEPYNYTIQHIDTSAGHRVKYNVIQRPLYHPYCTCNDLSIQSHCPNVWLRFTSQFDDLLQGIYHSLAGQRQINPSAWTLFARTAG